MKKRVVLRIADDLSGGVIRHLLDSAGHHQIDLRFPEIRGGRAVHKRPVRTPLNHAEKTGPRRKSHPANLPEILRLQKTDCVIGCRNQLFSVPGEFQTGLLPGPERFFLRSARPKRRSRSIRRSGKNPSSPRHIRFRFLRRHESTLRSVRQADHRKSGGL